MAIQILPQVEQRPDYSFLGNFGAGLAQGLTRAAHSKLQEFQQRRTMEANREGLRKLGLPDSVVDFIQTLPPEQQLEYAISYHQGQQEQPQQQPQGLDALLGMGGQPSPQQGEQNQLQDILGALGGPQGAQGLEQFLSPAQGKSLRMQQAFGQQAPMQEAPQQMAPQVQAPMAKPKGAQEFFQSVARAKAQPKPAELAKLKATERKEAIRAEEMANKETKQYYADTVANEKAAKQNLMRLNRMETLIEKGSLPFAAFYNLWESAVPAASKSLGKLPLVGGIVESVGDAIGWAGKSLQRNITARDTEEFEKLSNDFVRDAKSIFGSRITDADLKVFMQTVPTLSQTNNGKKHIIRNMKLFNEAAQAESQAMKEIIKENGGKRPFNLQELVSERTQSKLDKLASKFTTGF